MPDRIWVGTTNDWNTAANWNPAAVPLDGENVHFTGDSVLDVDGLTLGVAGDALGGIFIHPDYTGSVGTTGSKIICASCTTIRHQGNGAKLFIESTGTMTDIVAAASAGVDGMLEIDGTITNLYIAGNVGGVTVTASAALTNIDMHDAPNTVLTVNSGVTALNRIRLSSGRLVNNSAVETGTAPLVVLTGGLLQHRTGNIDSLFIGGNGRVEHTAADPTADVAIGTLVGWGPSALFDGRKNRQTIATIDNAFGFAGFTALFKNALDSYVLTNGFINFGAVADFEPGKAVS